MFVRSVACFLGATLALVLVAKATPIELDLAKSHDVEITEPEPGVYAIRTTGGDPWVVSKPLPSKAAESNHVLELDYFCPDGIDQLTLYFGPPWSEGFAMSAGAMPRAEAWSKVAADLSKEEKTADGFRSIRFDFGSKAGITLRVRGIRLREPTAEEKVGTAERDAARARKQAHAEAYQAYLSKKYRGTIREVRVDADTITLRGSAPGDGHYSLAEIAFHEQPWLMKNFKPVRENLQGEFTVSLPRKDGVRDRIDSRWALVGRGDVLASHAKFPTDLTGALRQAPLPPLFPKTKKGMAGVGERGENAELLELGIHAVTINVPVTPLLMPGRHQHRETIEFEGETFTINTQALAKTDETVAWATANQIVVTGIPLVVMPKEESLRRRLAHPEASEAGLYVMPNFTTEEGSRTFRALMRFLAERYSRADGRYGRIARWVMHNEIDQAWTWTNMGDQPMPLVLEHYARALRAMHHAAREWDPTARTFISLTHYWTAPEKPNYRQYRPKEMLELLAATGAAEGDFEWGVAYHPYPESLLEPATWQDTKPTFTFDTPFITPKNIEVLDAYMHQPQMKYLGKTVRTVMLTEQGFHTRDYSPETQRIQAAAFVYTWHKIRPLETIETFHNHRWIDHPDEGGLLLGLRTLPTVDHPLGEKKLAFDIYKSLDTPGERQATEFAKELIGIQDWSEVPFRSSID